MVRYSGDPYWTTAKFAGKCHGCEAPIEADANEKLVSAGGQPDRLDDCLWALSAIALDLGDYIIQPATTQAARDAEQAASRHAYLRGDII